FFKQVISGALIAIVMTGLDQDMMQKNLSCRNLREAQKNMATFSFILIFANLLFLSLGALLYIYAAETGINIPERTDQLYPTIALQHLPVFAGIVFIIGLTAAAYSSADSALTALTTSFCVDFLDIEKKDAPESAKTKTRLITHVGFTIATFLVIIIFNAINNEAVINKLFTIAGYTYGPLLGLFTFGILMKNYQVRDRWAPLVCIAAPLVSWLIDANSAALLGGFTFGFLIVALNGWLTFIGLWAVSYKETRLAEI
ncbi:MAG TPA: sodium:solute symporter, partial [Saprospiraceae bacterium]|nr:sodium:solute symporter [Saprospiraceae bacterium]